MRKVDRVVGRVRRMPPIVADGGIGAGIVAIGIVEVLLGNDPTSPASQRPEALAILAVSALSVTLKRTNLRIACALVLLAALGGDFWTNGFNSTWLAELIVLYTVSEHSSFAVSVLALVAAFGIRIVANFGPVSGATLSDVISGLPQLIQIDVFYSALAWFAGRAQARCRAVTSDLERSTAVLREEQDRLARSAVETERGQIARELYALVMRGVEQMNTDTRAARRSLERDAAQASGSIAAIEAAGRGALVEMRRLLVVLRAGSDATASSVGNFWRTEQVPRFAIDRPRSLASSLAEGRRPSRAPAFAEQTRQWIATPWVTDVVVVLVMAILAVAERFSFPEFMHRRIDVVLAAVVVAALLFRRASPFVVLAFIALVIFVSTAFLTFETTTADHAIFVAVFTVAALRGPWWGVAAVGVEVLAYAPLLQYFARTQSVSIGIAILVGWSALFVFAVIAGVAVREGRRMNLELAEQTDLLRRTREERVRLAVDQERTRIARDVHDMVAHGVTLMVIQAGAARWLAESNPRRAGTALDSVERAGQESLHELQSLLGSLGGASTRGAELLPVDEHLTIRSLVDGAVEAGMHVELVVQGEPRQLDAGLEVSLSRIVQEALTNVRKHAPGARAWVELRFTREGVDVQVTDVGGHSATRGPPVPGAGQGLVGIAERAALFGGRAEAGPTPEGGFRVRASLVEERVLV